MKAKAKYFLFARRVMAPSNVTQSEAQDLQLLPFRSLRSPSTSASASYLCPCLPMSASASPSASPSASASVSDGNCLLFIRNIRRAGKFLIYSFLLCVCVCVCVCFCIVS
ncbi:hypothetical protein E2C01_086600 [Portunus trituberculatus]|uniref:Uncharacterized protein n=1 Tax=Portunus trituberculatus TaxID=210409 RepID=A0A5B7JGT1_PORTR|nr:hypothetical protein [Portunus trituberculatus]